MKKFPRKYINKYTITLAIFIIIMLFFNRNSIPLRWKTSRNVKSLEKEIRYYKDEIEENKTKVHSMQTDLKTLEKHAREEYYLKKENEDIFIIREEE